MYVDYAGDRLELVDRDSGGIIAVEVFVAILPCSQLTYVEAVMSQRKEDFIRCCENALHFYGGAPAGHRARQSQGCRKEGKPLRGGAQ